MRKKVEKKEKEINNYVGMSAQSKQWLYHNGCQGKGATGILKEDLNESLHSSHEARKIISRTEALYFNMSHFQSFIGKKLKILNCQDLFKPV